MGLFQRISDLLRSNINDLISKAEDPEKMLNAAIQEMQKQIIEAKSRVAMSIADEKRLSKQYERHQAKAEDWEKKAMSAVRAGRDDLAVEALARKKENIAAAAQFEDQLEGQKKAVQELNTALSELTAKLQETKRKRSLLLARAKRAEAQRHIASTLSAVSENSASERLERLEARVERAEAEAEATWELAAYASGHEDRDLASEIDMLEAGPLSDDLAALKAKMNDMGMLEAGERAALPSGEMDALDDVEDAVDAEIEEDDEDIPSEKPRREPARASAAAGDSISLVQDD